MSATLLGALACVSSETPVEVAKAPSEPARPAVDPEGPAPTDASEPTREPEPAAVAKAGPDPGPPSLRYGPVPDGHRRLVAISQTRPPLEMGWIMVPRHPLVYAEGDSECAVIDVRTGAVVARSEHGLGSTCDEWMSGEVPDGRSSLWPEYASADEQLLVESMGDALQITDAKDQVRSLRADGADLISPSWAPSGHRIAAVAVEWQGMDNLPSLRLMVWNADSGKRLVAKKLAVPGEPADIALYWNERGVVVVVEHYPADIYDEDYEGPTSVISSFFWKDGSSKIQRRLELAQDVALATAEIDASGRWLLSYREDDDGERVRARFWAIALADQSSTLDWRWSTSWDEDEEGFELHDEGRGRWREDATTQWLETTIDQTGSEQRTALELSWRALVVEPTPSAHGRRIYAGKGLDEDGLSPVLELFGVREDAALLDWGLDEFAEHPEKTRLQLGPCEVIDAAPQLDLALAACDSLALVRVSDGAIERSFDLALHSFVWGRSRWLALFDEVGKLVIVDLDSKRITFQSNDIADLVDVALGSSFDRLGVIRGGKFELLDAAGKSLISLPRPEGKVALAPDGRRLALIVDGQAQVVSLDSGEILASWPEGEGIDLAWRQDGAALLVGWGLPQKMVDPSDGALLATLGVGDWAELEPEMLDPSWRWARLADGRIMRTLDGMTLSFGPGWIRLDSGLYEGKVDLGAVPSLRWRTDEDPFAVPKLDSAAVKPWVERKGLMAAFFGGETIAPPSIPIAKLRKR